MPTLGRPDGVELAFEERGEGPPVVFAPYWSGYPGVFEGLISDLARDHRVIGWDARGTGQSTRAGPYDMDTDCGDLEAILEIAGGPSILVGVADGANRAVRVAADRPDLVRAVVAMGTAPMSRHTFEGTEGMLASSTVIDAFIQMLESDYRAALRTVLTATNTQMSEDELRERVSLQASYAPREASVARVRAWIDDEPTDAARRTGDRLWVFTSTDVAGPWLPSAEVRRRLAAELMPEAHLVEGEEGEGPVSRPDVAAELIRAVGAPLRR
jgi:pimeloyl-ACP methyl ester carboxylesterase